MEEHFGGFFCINAFGRIEAGDDVRFQEFLQQAKPPPRTCVYIDSIGGHVEAAIGIGRIIRDSWFATSIGKYVLDFEVGSGAIIPRRLHAGQCLSSATLVYLGGRLRHFPDDAKFGVHQFSFRDPTPEHIGQSQMLSAKIASYVADMGIAAGFLELSSSTPGESIEYVERSLLKELGVITEGQTDVTWSVQARNHMLYVRGERDSLFGHHKVMLCYVKGQGFMFWAVIESQGRETELTKHSLVEIVVNDEDIRIDISDRCERGVFGIYVNVLAKISDEEARQLAFSESFGVQIRFSELAEMFLGVGAMDTSAGREELETFFNTLSA